MVKIRLSRLGRKKLPRYRIVVVDSRAKRDGRFIELLGYYNPLAVGSEKVCEILDEAKLVKWHKNGAQFTDTVLRLVKKQGIELS